MIALLRGWLGWALGLIAVALVALVGLIATYEKPTEPEEAAGLAGLPTEDAPPEAAAVGGVGDSGDDSAAPVAGSTPSETTQATQTDPTPETADEATAETTNEAEAPADPAPDSAEATTPAPLPPPDFDVVRVSPDGSAVVAGFAEPGAAIEVLVDGTKAAEAAADGAGNFVALFDMTLIDRPQVLQLSAARDGGERVLSETTFIIEPMPKLAAVDPAPEVPPAPETAEQQAETPPSPSVESQDPAAPETTVEAETDLAMADTTGDTPDASPAERLAGVSSEPMPPTQQGTPAPGMPSTEPPTTEAPTTEAPTMEAPAMEAPATNAEDPARVAAVEPSVPTPGQAAPSAGTEAPPLAAASLAPRILRVDRDGIKVMEDPVAEALSIDTIAYEDDGAVTLTGRGSVDTTVRLYLDNSVLGDAAVDAAGRWSLTEGDIVPGVYSLRADALDAEGKVVARVETPFKREDPARLVAQTTPQAVPSEAGGATDTPDATPAMDTTRPVQADAPAVDESIATPDTPPTGVPSPARPDATDAANTAAAPGEPQPDPMPTPPATTGTEAPPVVAVTVQPGSTLWAIATERYGEGIRYVQVFEANRDKIRDPDLIYPGQVFELPGQ
ncbi:LysM peptidoglycan-binding domain-containing protein [uncultured Maritimibacter sp.]|jgi:nucleoid-associated protein YgaU|uniref:LysM peptidoglycan-binding domain-containing protein n=1 Tax=uncultured Maritimibacter sp. TaxID=991866 RepID=UPI000AA7BCA6|nr:LysM peptidoglycan-binding domain-containing protein [uncultured Maritimibacter sp.]